MISDCLVSDPEIAAPADPAETVELSPAPEYHPLPPQVPIIPKEDHEVSDSQDAPPRSQKRPKPTKTTKKSARLNKR